MAQREREASITEIFSEIIPYILSVIIAFAVAGFFIGISGYNVLQAYYTIIFTSFSSIDGMVLTLQKFVPILLLTLSFTITLVSGKFNIGGEGQMLLGAIGATIVGITLSG